MKSTLVIIGLAITSLLAVVAGSYMSTEQIKVVDKVTLQDDKSGDHLLFYTSTGEYKLERCKGDVTLSGKGAVTVNGCSVVLKDATDTGSVLAEVDLCAKAGKAEVSYKGGGSAPVSEPVSFTIADSNIVDSTFDCSTPFVSPK